MAKPGPKPARTTPATRPPATTIADVLADVPHLGPWQLVGPLNMIRNDAGDCPLVAFARNRGRWVGTKSGGTIIPDSGHAVARHLGMTEADGDDLADAADGLGETFEKFEFPDAARVKELRVKLLAACGLKEQPRQRKVTRRQGTCKADRRDRGSEEPPAQGGGEECPRRSA